MALFHSNTSYLGVDIGSASIKIVELKPEKGRPRLVTYGYVEEETHVVKSDSRETQDFIVEVIQKILKEARMISRKAVAALPSFAVFSSVITLPAMSSKELVNAVKWEAKKFVPMPLEEMVLDWKVLKDESEKRDRLRIPRPLAKKPESSKEGTPEPQQSEKKDEHRAVKVLLTAAPRSLVERTVGIFKKAHIELVSLETQSFALQRSLIGNDRSVIMMLDIGAVSTDISVVVGGIPVLNRSIDVGGATITTALANTMNIDSNRAEQFKRDFGITGEGPEEKVPKTIEFTFTAIVNEIRYVLNLYSGQHDTPIEKIILAGGSAFLPHLSEYLSSVLNIKTYLGDPWARVVYPVDLRPVLQELGPRFAVSVGLAMREIV